MAGRHHEQTAVARRRGTVQGKGGLQVEQQLIVLGSLRKSCCQEFCMLTCPSCRRRAGGAQESAGISIQRLVHCVVQYTLCCEWGTLKNGSKVPESNVLCGH